MVTVLMCAVVVVLCRSKRHGSASVRRARCSASSRTSRLRYSSRAPWSSGPPGSTTWSVRSSSPTRTGRVSLKRPASSCSNGPFIGKLISTLFLLRCYYYYQPFSVTAEFHWASYVGASSQLYGTYNIKGLILY